MIGRKGGRSLRLHRVRCQEGVTGPGRHVGVEGIGLGARMWTGLVVAALGSATRTFTDELVDDEARIFDRMGGTAVSRILVQAVWIGDPPVGSLAGEDAVGGENVLVEPGLSQGARLEP